MGIFRPLTFSSGDELGEETKQSTSWLLCPDRRKSLAASISLSSILNFLPLDFLSRLFLGGLYGEDGFELLENALILFEAPASER